MASAAAGERLGQRHQVALYSAQSTYGTPVTPATSLGACEWELENNSNNLRVFGPGSASALAVRGGTVESRARLRWSHVQTGVKTLLQKVGRSSSVVPLVTVGLGYKDDEGTPVRSASQLQDAKVGRLSLAFDKSQGNAPITAEMELVGGLITTVTSLDPATLATTPWMVADCHFTRGGSSYPIVALTCEIDNDLAPIYKVSGTAPSSFHRGHAELLERQIRVRGSMTLQATSGVTLLGQTISSFAAVMTCTNPDDAVSLILTFAGMTFDEETMSGKDELLWTIGYTATSCAIT
ncbi:MAG: hypothetical protein FJX77_14290 [Armatimonadetes bacterium]|nr:hypothetical protein [Armatimonadota bacterium]